MCTHDGSRYCAKSIWILVSTIAATELAAEAMAINSHARPVPESSRVARKARTDQNVVVRLAMTKISQSNVRVALSESRPEFTARRKSA